MRVMFVMIMMCLLAGLAYGQDNHQFRWTVQIGAEDEPINWQPFPPEGVTWEMDGDLVKLRVVKPAPFPKTNRLLIGAIVETEPHLVPQDADGAWHKALLDLSVIGQEVPKQGERYVWLSYMHPFADWSDAAPVILSKRKADVIGIVPPE